MTFCVTTVKNRYRVLGTDPEHGWPYAPVRTRALTTLDDPLLAAALAAEATRAEATLAAIAVTQDSGPDLLRSLPGPGAAHQQWAWGWLPTLLAHLPRAAADGFAAAIGEHATALADATDDPSTVLAALRRAATEITAHLRQDPPRSWGLARPLTPADTPASRLEEGSWPAGTVDLDAAGPQTGPLALDLPGRALTCRACGCRFTVRAYLAPPPRPAAEADLARAHEAATDDAALLLATALDVNRLEEDQAFHCGVLTVDRAQPPAPHTCPCHQTATNLPCGHPDAELAWAAARELPARYAPALYWDELPTITLELSLDYAAVEVRKTARSGWDWALFAAGSDVAADTGTLDLPEPTSAEQLGAAVGAVLTALGRRR